MKPTLAHSLNGFDSITLDQLNTTMSLMERVDTKYIINYAQADELIQKLKEKFFILQIKDMVIFKYDNIYMDTQDYDLYYEHELGDDMRNKVRTRNYADSKDLCFFEYKHKMNKVTRKFRFQCPVAQHGTMSSDAEDFFAGIYESLNGDKPTYKLSASLATRYHRITLCAKDSGEKVTIDFGFEFEDMRGGVKYNLDEIVIVESKSNSEHCSTGKIMKKMKVHQAKGCSKYCLGLLYTQKISESKRFAGTMKMLQAITDAANAQKHSESEKVIRKAVRKVTRMATMVTGSKVKEVDTTRTNQSKIAAAKGVNGFTSKKIVTTP